MTDFLRPHHDVAAHGSDTFTSPEGSQSNRVEVQLKIDSSAPGGSLKEYDRFLKPARDRFATSSAVLAIQSSEDRAFLEAFLLYFSVLGSRMTEPVESWLLSASERCAALGLADLAKALNSHARAEAGHHLMMVADARSLAARRLASGLRQIDVEALLQQAPAGGSLRYVKAHEAALQGAEPYAQVAIEYEIEMLPILYGDILVRHCVAILGSDILSCLSFVTEHIVLDAAHTQFNARLLERLLHSVPQAMPALVNAGTEILEAYAEFLEDCVKLAERDAAARVIPSDRTVRPLVWRMHAPPSSATPCDTTPEWLAEVRRLRANVLFQDGRRPRFRTQDGHFEDDDPIDIYAYHILVYDQATLVGCVRVFRLGNAEVECVAEQVLGRKSFSAMLEEQNVMREDTTEIGRWIGKSTHRRNGLIAIQLAAAAAALAARIEQSDAVGRHMVVCAVGTADGQDLILTRIGMTAVAGLAPTHVDDLDDDLRVLYTVGGESLKEYFHELMNRMARTIEVAA